MWRLRRTPAEAGDDTSGQNRLPSNQVEQQAAARQAGNAGQGTKGKHSAATKQGHQGTTKTANRSSNPAPSTHKSHRQSTTHTTSHQNHQPPAHHTRAGATQPLTQRSTERQAGSTDSRGPEARANRRRQGTRQARRLGAATTLPALLAAGGSFLLEGSRCNYTLPWLNSLRAVIPGLTRRIGQIGTLAVYI